MGAGYAVLRPDHGFPQHRLWCWQIRHWKSLGLLVTAGITGARGVDDRLAVVDRFVRPLGVERQGEMQDLSVAVSAFTKREARDWASSA